MSKTVLKNLMKQLSEDNLNLVTSREIVAGSDSGSWMTISGAWDWSVSDLWDSTNPNACQNICQE